MPSRVYSVSTCLDCLDCLPCVWWSSLIIKIIRVIRIIRVLGPRGPGGLGARMDAWMCPLSSLIPSSERPCALWCPVVCPPCSPMPLWSSLILRFQGFVDPFKKSNELEGDANDIIITLGDYDDAT